MKRFTFHIVNIKVADAYIRYQGTKFTFHIVNIKDYTKEEVDNLLNRFTFHIVNIKVDNKIIFY